MVAPKTSRGAVSVLATSFLVLATSLSGSAQEASDEFTITVQQPEDPCLMYTDMDATWSVDPWVNLTTDNANQSNLIQVYPGTEVSVSLGWSFMDAYVCGSNTPATGYVYATWTLPGLDLSDETCLEGCAVTSTSTTARVEVPVDATPDDYVGTISLNWVP
jgi:hypothetical protein